jgi:riboflavin synthase
MFTGIIEAIGTVQGLEARGEDTWRLQVESQLGPELSPGASLAVNGCCLTVTASKGRQLSFDLLAETAKRTNLGGVASGELINLERPMAANGRFDGHIVQGHVDCPAAIKSLESVGADHRLEIELPVEFARYVVFKGSITVDGISLTVAELLADRFAVWIIPHTWAETNLQQRQAGGRVNLEFDLVAKYVERLLGLRI